MHDGVDGMLGGRTLDWVGRDTTCRLASARMGRGRELT